MKKLISMVLLLCIISVISTTAAQAATVESGINSTTWKETFTDKESNEIVIDYLMNGEDITTTVYLNGVLTQKAYIIPDHNLVLFQDYSATLHREGTFGLTPTVISYKYSDFVNVENTISLESTDKIFESRISWDPEGWSYYGYYPTSPIYPTSKPTTLYFRNYDEEPNLNKFLIKQVDIGIGTPISVAVGLVASFITGGLSGIVILTTIGCSIVADLITNAVSVELCYSTQKIRYAPIIEGINIFTDAYITKLWLISYDKLTGEESIKLANPAYEFNRGETPDSIAINAQIAWLSY